MNTKTQLARLLAGAAIFFGLPALGGGPTNQGVLMAGQGLDWQRTATEIQRVSIPIRPGLNLTFAGLVGPNFTLGAAQTRLVHCVKYVRYAKCQAEVTLAAGHVRTKFCGRWLTGSPITAWLYVVKGAPVKGAIDFAQSTKLTFACAIKEDDLNVNPGLHALEWETLGAIAKCILWPPDPANGVPGRVVPDADPHSLVRFNTCIRAVRADYCGDGVTYTKDQTQIFLMSEAGAWDATAMASRRGLNFKYEANWKEDGAVCVVRSRYESLAPDCQTEFKNTEGFEGVQYHCKGSPPDLHHGELLTDSKEQQ